MIVDATYFKENDMKRLVIFIAFLFALFSCRQNTQHSVPDITITVKVDDGINLKDEKPIKAKRGVLWKELKSIADSKIETKKEYVFSEWRVKEKEGKVLIDDVVFSQDETVYAISKKIERKVKIHIKGDERVTILGDDFIDVDILLPKTFKDVEAKIKAKLNLKPEWSNGDYDIFDWKLNNENGQLILQNTPIKEDITVFARTNYTKFDIEGSTIKGYKGEKPRGRIIIPKEITSIGYDREKDEYYTPFSSCEKIIDVDLSLCKELTYLDLGDTGIVNIDLSHSPHLDSLTLSSTKIKSIDLSCNIELDCLDLSSTELKNVDISHNSKLSNLYLNLAGITSIDLSCNSKLSHLEMDHTDLKTIDLSHNPELDYLDLRNTKIESIDLSNNAKLKFLRLDFAKITTIDLSSNAELTKLYLGSTEITDVDLSKNKKLTYINFSESKITNIDLSHNTELDYLFFYKCSALKKVVLSTCTKLMSLTESAFEGASNAIVTLSSNVTTIDVGAFGNKEANYCKKVIVPNNEIKQLVIDSEYPEERIELRLLTLEFDSDKIDCINYTSKDSVTSGIEVKNHDKFKFSAKLEDGKIFDSWCVNGKRLNEVRKIFVYEVNSKDANSENVIKVSFIDREPILIKIVFDSSKIECLDYDTKEVILDGQQLKERTKLMFTAKLQDGKTIESWYINNKKLNKSSNVFLYKINPREANNKVIEISYKLKK